MKRAISLLASVVMLLSLAACGTGAKSDYSVDTVTLTYVKSPLNVPSIVEKAQQSFEAAFGDMGLGFAYSDLNSGADQTAALASGDIQILNAVGASSVILSAANGADIKIIGMYSTSPAAFCMYSADDSLQSPEDLRGKTIAGPKGTNLHELLDAYLATAGMTEGDVNFVSMDIPSSLAALEGGSVDCALLAGAHAYNCAAAGYHLVTDGTGLISGAIVTATTQAFYDSDRAIVDTFCDVFADTLDYINANTAEALAMAAEETELDMEAVESMYALYDFHTEATQQDIESLQNTADFMLSAGLIENQVDASTLFIEN